MRGFSSHNRSYRKGSSALQRCTCAAIRGSSAQLRNNASWPLQNQPKSGVSFMPEVQVRKKFTAVEEIFHEGGPASTVPLRRAAALAVIRNPFSGAYVKEIAGFMDDLKPLGLEMPRALVTALGGDPKVVGGYGKGAIIGSAGELEHGALWHVPGGYAMRELLGWKGDRAAYAKGQAGAATAGTPGQPGNALAIVPSTKKVGPPGAALDVPLTHINASYVRGHFDAIEVRVPGAPAAD